MINGFIFNQDVVIHMLLIVAAVLCAFVMAGLLTLFMIDLVERDCRRDIRFDEDGRESGWKRHPDNPLQDFHIYERGER